MTSRHSRHRNDSLGHEASRPPGDALVFSVGNCLFLLGFMIGRCARKLPVLDDTVPWTMNWLFVLTEDGS